MAGINEKGLVVVDASPSSLAPKEEDYSAIPLTQGLLTRCASVDEVLAQKELLRASYPVFEMVADRHKVAVIEIAPEGRCPSRSATGDPVPHQSLSVIPTALGQPDGPP